MNHQILIEGSLKWVKLIECVYVEKAILGESFSRRPELKILHAAGGGYVSLLAPYMAISALALGDASHFYNHSS